MKRFVSFLAVFILTLITVSAVLTVGVGAGEVQSDGNAPECYQQNDVRWANKQDIGPSGCGLISLVNAVHYLTGNFIDPEGLAIYAHKIDAYNGSVGGGTARWVLYHQLKDYEKKYGFKVTLTGTDANVRDSRLINHLKDGGAAVAHVYGHFIAIVGYNAENKTYLIYDCAANYERRGTTTGGDWMTVKELTTMQYMTVDWFCLIEATEGSVNTNADGITCQNRAADNYIRLNKDELSAVEISGSAYSTRGIKSISYVVDYDFGGVYPFIENIEDGENTVRYSETIDLSAFKNWSYGVHSLRFYAETLDGGVCDIAEYKISLNKNDVITDAENHTFELGMSGFNGQSGIVNKLANLKNGNKFAYKLEEGAVLNLGRIDLSKYEYAVINYSVRSAFTSYAGTENPFVIGMKTSQTTFGNRENGVDDANSIGYSLMEDGSDEGLEIIRQAIIDLTNTDYDGYVYLSANTEKYFAVREIVFCEKNEETTAEETTADETIEEETIPEETSVQEITDEDTSDGDTENEGLITFGCDSAICGVLPVIAAVAVLFIRKRKENE